MEPTFKKIGTLKDKDSNNRYQRPTGVVIQDGSQILLTAPGLHTYQQNRGNAESTAASYGYKIVWY